MSLMALGFTACYDYEEVLPQSTEQPTVLEMNGVEVAAGAQLGDAIDLNTFEGDTLELILTTATPQLNEGVSVQYRVEIAADANYSSVEAFDLTDGKLLKSQLDDAFRALIGKTPNARPLYFRFAPYMSDGESRVRIGASTDYMLASQMAVTPVDLGIRIDEAYYIVTDTWLGEGWQESAVRLEHSDLDVYDDPEFSILCTLPVGQIQFLGQEGFDATVADPSVYMTYVWGPSVAGSMSGSLVQGETAGVVNITTAGQYLVTLNMLDRTFSVQLSVPTLYAVGNFNSWTHSADNFIYEKTQGEHSGFVDMTGDGSAPEFKFSQQLSWDGISYGAGDGEGVLSTDGGAGNLTLDEAGIYYFKLHVAELTYTAQKVDSWGIIGNATPGAWDTETALEYQGGLVWSGVIAMTPGEYKFRANNDWSLSLGTAADNLIDNGGNIVFSGEAGTYLVTLDLSDARQYKATFELQQ